MDTTHIKFTKKQRDFIKKAALRGDQPMGEWAYQCVYFIHRHRYDPYMLEDIMLGVEFKKLKDQLIGFIRTQEKDYLTPMMKTVQEMATSQSEFSVVLQHFTADNAVLVDDTPEDSDRTLSEAFKNQQTDTKQQEIDRLKNILVQKDDMLNKLRQATVKIKNASLARKGQIYLNLTEDEFNKLVSIT